MSHDLEWYTLAEAAELLRRQPETVRRWVRRERRAGRITPAHTHYRPLGATIILPSGRVQRLRKLYLRGDAVALLARRYLLRLPAHRFGCYT